MQKRAVWAEEKGERKCVKAMEDLWEWNHVDPEHSPSRHVIRDLCGVWLAAQWRRSKAIAAECLKRQINNGWRVDGLGGWMGYRCHCLSCS